MSQYTVVSLFPGLLNIHGDAENAQVLAARASWAGHESHVVEAQSAEDLKGLNPQSVIIGSGFDSDAGEVLNALQPMAGELRRWLETGASLLAIGLGWELLSESTEHGTTALEGLGIFSGRFVSSSRAVGPMSLRSRWGRLVGYEYHYRDYLLGADETALGDAEAGVGNVIGASTKADAPQAAEGAVRGKAIGTTMRGPILARNPTLADAMLGDYVGTNDSSPARRAADEYAAKTNRRVIEQLKLRTD